MKLNDLIGNDFPEIAAQLSPQAGDVEIAAITADSRQVVPGSLFVALAGTKADGAGFVSDAIARGACAVIAAPGVSPSSAVPVLQAANPRRVLALAAARFYGRQPQTMVAVTGTAGKTSVASFVRQIWAHSGLAAAMIGTTGVIAPGRNDYGSLTTPDPVSLHRLLTELADAGVTHAAMEASSHGLDQSRLDGVAP